MQYIGELRKMPVALNSDDQVLYTLKLYDTEHQEEYQVPFNEHIGKDIKLNFTGKIYCKRCGRATNKSFNQGFCYPCFRDAPEAAECIIKPELCRAHLGEGRDPEWEETHHNRPHIVYLAATNMVKVGVTRGMQIPIRWIDQGASSAIILARTPNRYTAGVIEVALKSRFTDKTNWRKMLKNEIDERINLAEVKKELIPNLSEHISSFVTEEENITNIHYPVIRYPSKIKSLNLDKTPDIEGTLLGIKGQYLLLDEDRVINLRNHAGYRVEFDL